MILRRQFFSGASSLGFVGRGAGVLVPVVGPIAALVSAAGASPLVLSGTDTGYDAGARVQWEFAASLAPAKNAPSGLDPNGGGYTATSQRGVTFIDGDSWARMDLACGFVTPSGAYSFHFRVLVDNENGLTTVVDQFGQSATYDAGPWSNDVADTIVTSAAVWTSATGAGKSQYLTPSNGNFTLTMNNSVNAACGCMASISASGKRYFESVILSHGNQTSASFAMGVCDAAATLGAAVFPNPGASGSIAGARWSVKNGSTATNVTRNGGSVAGTALSVAAANGDKYGINFDTVANTVSFFHKPVSTGTWYTVQTITLTSQIPTNWRAYTAGFGETGAGTTPPADAWTTNFGASAFDRALDAGYSMYG